MIILKRKSVIFISLLLLITVNVINSQEAKMEGQAGDKFENNKDANIVLRVVLLADEPDKMAFTVENIGKHDVCINAIGQGNNEIKIKKPDGTFWVNKISKRTSFMRFKPSQNLIHTKLPIQLFFEMEKLISSGYYEITWVVDGKWKSNTIIVYVPEPVKDTEKDQPDK